MEARFTIRDTTGDSALQAARAHRTEMLRLHGQNSPEFRAAVIASVAAYREEHGAQLG